MLQMSQVLVFEDAAGYLVKSVVMKRNQCDSGVAIEATKAVQKQFENKVKRLSFDRGFHSPENQQELSKIIPHLCLPKPGAKQSVVQLTNGVLVADGITWRFSQDCTFGSLSTAATFVLGRSSNGRTSWKDSNGRTLKEIQEAETNTSDTIVGRSLLNCLATHSETTPNKRIST